MTMDPTKKLKQLLDVNGPRIRELKKLIAEDKKRAEEFGSVAKALVEKRIRKLRSELRKLNAQNK